MLTRKCSQASSTKIAIDDVSIFVFNKDYMNLKCYYRVVEFKSGWKSIKNRNWPTPISQHKYTHTFQGVYERILSSRTVVIYRTHNPFSHEPPPISIDFFPLMLFPFTWMRVNHKWIQFIFPSANSLLPLKCQRSYMFGMPSSRTCALPPITFAGLRLCLFHVLCNILVSIVW